MNHIDPQGTRKPMKEDIIAFFKKPGFLRLTRTAIAQDEEDE